MYTVELYARVRRAVHVEGRSQREVAREFGLARILAVIAGVECEAHDLVFDLPHSDDGFVVAFPAETTEAFLEGHVRAFNHFGGVPPRILHDNTTLAVARILGRELAASSSAQSKDNRGCRLHC